MTRINCIPVEELSNEHLRAEYREMPRIAKAAKRLPNPPLSYRMGNGHMKFFYDKGEWLRKRYEEEIVPAMQSKGYKTTYTKYPEHPPGLNNDWTPTKTAMRINLRRLKERDPWWYRCLKL